MLWYFYNGLLYIIFHIDVIFFILIILMMLELKSIDSHKGNNKITELRTPIDSHRISL